ncbi:MAG TPA: nucleotidyltransferase domain-containing protein [Ktedonobacterales bacterium]|jgi:predicted nucleotidyltransferase|nr:nucleotidyltransferase domain-containing protein [Ktedonobacterales bacterium]
MDDSDVHALIEDIVGRLRPVAGVAAIALGGSRARGTATPRSDVDLALYYAPESPLDLDELQRVAQAVDEEHRMGLLTAIGGWGPWINGGGWLHVRGMPVDFLYRDLHQVATAIQQCRAGDITIAYQPGHPHGFLTSIYLAEAALCRILWDPHDALQGLKARTAPYPPLLKRALIEKFSWEAGFALQNARKGALYADLVYVAGCCFRSVSCLLQTLFALNERYWMNEKGALALAATFLQSPQRLAERVTGVFASLSDHEDRLLAAIQALDDLVRETAGLLKEEPGPR